MNEYEEMYCYTHFDHHEEFYSRKPHKVIDAIGRLQDTICRKHDNQLQKYFITDQPCIYVLCKEYEHKNHNCIRCSCIRTEKQVWNYTGIEVKISVPKCRPNHFHFFFCGAYNRKYLKNLIYFSLYVKSYKSFQLQEDINVALK